LIDCEQPVIEQRSAPVRILVCISEEEQSQAVIRYAARVGVELGAELLALHVEPPGAATRRPARAAQRLEHNLRLARDLGAHVTVIDSHRIVDTILRYAHEHGVQRIIVGTPRPRTWRHWFTGDIVTRLLRETDIPIEVAPLSSGALREAQ
jgi:two-component system sensor histidine kinase KdpD